MGHTRSSTPRELEIRTENRYTLHPQDKKRCTKCEMLYVGIAANFDIHHKKVDGTVVYAGQCRTCLASVRAERTHRYKQDINLYVRRFLPAVRCRAKEEALQFDLDAEWLVEIWARQDGRCYYTNDLLDLSATTEKGSHPHLNFPSLDRRIPAEGYVKENVVWTSYGVNRMKNNLTDTQFIELCKTVTLNVGTQE